MDLHALKMRRDLLTLLLFVLSLDGTAWAKDLPGGLRVRAHVSPPQVIAGAAVELAVTIDLPDGWVVYDIEQAPMSVLPTRIDLENDARIAPTGAIRSEEALEEPAAQFGGRLARYFDRSPTFRQSLVIARDARPEVIHVKGKITFLALQRTTRRFYVVNDAPFAAKVEIAATPTPVASNAESAVSTEAPPIIDAVPAEPPPPFRIVIDASPLSTPSWNPLFWLVAAVLGVILGASAAFVGWVLLPRS